MSFVQRMTPRSDKTAGKKSFDRVAVSSPRAQKRPKSADPEKKLTPGTWSRMVLRMRLETCNLVEGLVAGDGFEPPTFGL